MYNLPDRVQTLLRPALPMLTALLLGACSTNAVSEDRAYLSAQGGMAGSSESVAQNSADTQQQEAPALVQSATTANKPTPQVNLNQTTATKPKPEQHIPQQPMITYTSVSVPGPYVAMTFDDGPHATNTPRLLDMLRQRNIKATFYVVGQNVQQYPGIVARMTADGHEVGNHSWSHPFFTKISTASVRSQLQRTHDAIVKASGKAPTTMRPPYGAITSSQKQWIKTDFGYPTIMWSLDPRDWQNRNAITVSNRILGQAKQGAIILAHDIHKSTIDAMPTVLDGLKARGYKFVTVSELIKLSQSPARTAPSITMKLDQP